MPDFLTHIAFAREAMPFLTEDARKKVKERQSLYFLGAQGPDVFFYGPKSPLDRNFSFFVTAKRLHGEWTGEFLEAGFARAESLPSEDQWDLWVYMLGMCCHYALDTRCHPYVYAFSGYRFNMPGADRRISRRHIQFENILDHLIWQDRTGHLARDEKTWAYLPRKIPRAVDRFFGDALEEIYGIDGYRSGDFAWALGHMRTFHRMFFDPWGIKEAIWNGLDRLTGGRFFVGRIFYPKSVRSDIDYLNLAHLTWHHPLTGIPSEASFPDVYSEAVDTIKEYFKKIGDPNAIGTRENIFEGYDYGTKLVWNSPENRREALAIGILREIK